MTAKGSDREDRAGKPELAKETIKDLDVPAGKAKGVKGGAGADQHTITCPVYAKQIATPSQQCTA
jgi:hypothetical protein